MKARDAAIYVRLHERQLKVLKGIAKRHEVSVSTLVRWGIDKVIERDIAEKTKKKK